MYSNDYIYNNNQNQNQIYGGYRYPASPQQVQGNNYNDNYNNNNNNLTGAYSRIPNAPPPANDVDFDKLPNLMEDTQDDIKSRLNSNNQSFQASQDRNPYLQQPQQQGQNPHQVYYANQLSPSDLPPQQINPYTQNQQQPQQQQQQPQPQQQPQQQLNYNNIQPQNPLVGQVLPNSSYTMFNPYQYEPNSVSFPQLTITNGCSHGQIRFIEINSNDTFIYYADVTLDITLIIMFITILLPCYLVIAYQRAQKLPRTKRVFCGICEYVIADQKINENMSPNYCYMVLKMIGILIFFYIWVHTRFFVCSIYFELIIGVIRFLAKIFHEATI